MNGLLGRSLLALLLCLATGGSLWVVSSVAGPNDDAPPSLTQAQAAHLGPLLPPVPQLHLDAVTPQAARSRSADAPPPAPQEDPLVKWAEHTGALLEIPTPSLVGYGVADLTMQQEEPGCRLSWITLAALGRVGSAEVAPQAGPEAATAAAKQLCARGRDTASAKGWMSAVRSVGPDESFVHRVFAAATTYASTEHAGAPLSAPIRHSIDFAIDQIGLPYIWGGNGPGRGDAGFDCSGLTSAAYSTAGISLPRTAHTQYLATPRIDSADLQPGDLVFYGTPSRIHHVGLYIGDGQMINAPTFGMPVQVAPYRYPGDDYAGAGRPIS